MLVTKVSVFLGPQWVESGFALGCVLSLGGSGLGSGFTLPIAISSEEESEPKVLTFLEEKVTPLGEYSRTFDLV